MVPRRSEPPRLATPEAVAAGVRAKALGPDDSRKARLERARVLCARLFAELLSERGIPNTDVSDHVGCGEKCVREFRSVERGRKPIGCRHAIALPKRLALAYLDALRLAVLNDTLDHHG